MPDLKDELSQARATLDWKTGGHGKHVLIAGAVLGVVVITLMAIFGDNALVP